MKRSSEKNSQKTVFFCLQFSVKLSKKLLEAKKTMVELAKNRRYSEAEVMQRRFNCQYKQEQEEYELVRAKRIQKMVEKRSEKFFQDELNLEERLNIGMKNLIKKKNVDLNKLEKKVRVIFLDGITTYFHAQFLTLCYQTILLEKKVENIHAKECNSMRNSITSFNKKAKISDKPDYIEVLDRKTRRFC